VDWATNGDPFFYESHHLSPRSTGLGDDAAVRESWVFYGTPKFAGKRLVLAPGARAELTEPGVYSVFAWSGSGTFAGQEIRGGEAGLDELLISHGSGTFAGQEIRGGEAGLDELLISHDTATRPHTVVSSGSEDLVVFSLFGPDLHVDVPAAGVGR
jgi:hypothetical protein